MTAEVLQATICRGRPRPPNIEVLVERPSDSLTELESQREGCLA